ncbi:MAG: metallophosphoesterase family protein [Patescibacteria group bacterium]|nr:metallophosphoesterase family protein [Patescibacteria group bacterium]
MKIIIISDIHDNALNLKKCLEYAKKIKAEALFCCGDVARGDTIKIMAEKFDGVIHLVRGNMCMFDDGGILDYNNIEYYGAIARFQINHYWVGLCHEPYKIDKMLALGQYDYIFYGHTHEPWEKIQNNTKIINPGTLNGIYDTSTFAEWNTEKDEVELRMIGKV